MLPSHLLLPGGSQIFQQRLAHHRAFRLGKRQPHFLFQLPDSIGHAGLRNIELLHCMADGAGNSREHSGVVEGSRQFPFGVFFLSYRRAAKNATYFLL